MLYLEGIHPEPYSLGCECCVPLSYENKQGRHGYVHGVTASYSIRALLNSIAGDWQKFPSILSPS